MPDLQKTYHNSGYEGAIVLPPKCAMYLDNPIACVDYAWPSCTSESSDVYTTNDLFMRLIPLSGNPFI